MAGHEAFNAARRAMVRLQRSERDVVLKQRYGILVMNFAERIKEPDNDAVARMTAKNFDGLERLIASRAINQ